MVPQGGGIAPLQVHMERLVLTMRLFSSAQDLARREDLSGGAVSPGPLGGGFTLGKASSSTQTRRLQRSGPASLAVRVPVMETLVGNSRAQ